MGVLESLGRLFRREESPALIFKSPEAALSYACQYLQSSVAEGLTLPCVVDTSEQADGDLEIAQIRVASPGAPRRMLAAFPRGTQFPPLYYGMLCAVQVGPIAGGLPTGLLVAQLRPRWTERGWEIERQLGS